MYSTSNSGAGSESVYTSALALDGGNRQDNLDDLLTGGGQTPQQVVTHVGGQRGSILNPIDKLYSMQNSYFSVDWEGKRTSWTSATSSTDYPPISDVHSHAIIATVISVLFRLLVFYHYLLSWTSGGRYIVRGNFTPVFWKYLTKRTDHLSF